MRHFPVYMPGDGHFGRFRALSDIKEPTLADNELDRAVKPPMGKLPPDIRSVDKPNPGAGIAA